MYDARYDEPSGLADVSREELRKSIASSKLVIDVITSVCSVIFRYASLDVLV